MKTRARWIGVALSVLTYVLTVFISWTTYETYKDSGVENYLIFKGLFFIYFASAGLADLSHFVCMVSSPVSVVSNSLSNATACGKCTAPKSINTYHCSRCQQCVYKMDHHCYWVNNCVGHYNQKIYILFLGYIAFFTSSSAFAIILQKTYCEAYWETLYCQTENQIIWKEYCKMIAILISLFFCLFVLYLLGEQYESIVTSASKIERLKGVQVKPLQNFWKNLEKVFGSRPGPLWLLPISPADIKLI